ncbi:hypothetical protein QNI19_04995 [Cytophagaceae bacterium DM2B3-1]|uniref:Uncharacterized protein n=1 Tax=Xanthocytophaga flava TaxID=3048013 RepID=A0AAE3U748_9BACT|nr:hypothetical protein [Xanthocytophaga flavus]MDJ1472266.1 hypothetical protein [Xanthocytophaga flavus]MDJ1482026.1 hypothetical protein [Xanthocytophaga flavus]MDJ1492277.1 hypothetical protein [Xanthocytophaga flavus]
MKSFSKRQIKLLLVLGPSFVFLFIYFLVSVLFVNTTDRHMLTTNRELKQYKPGMYHRFINVLHEKMLFVEDKKPKHPKHHISHSTESDSSKIHVSKHVAH